MSSKTSQSTRYVITNAQELIGKLCDSRFAYYDHRAQEYKYKLRPVLIVGVERDKLPCDITVFPVSKISRQENIDKEFDYPLTQQKHKSLNLKYDPSYVRVHKVTTIHTNDLSFDYTNCNLNDNYPDTMSEILNKYKEFSSKITS
ncbi:hypothetical protein MTP04_02900 [Lysinibacillus sp. PLM2]|nr:hypothetical protein MTP04_02900 [Lysinibacillus sp. PLM2]